MAKKKPAASAAPFSEAIRAAIRERGLTAYALGKESGVSVDAIQRFLNGERDLRLKTADALARALGLTVIVPPPAD